MNSNPDPTQIFFKTRQFIWYNPVLQDVVTTSILTQNQNGPCALIALLNCMILSHLFNKFDEKNSPYNDEAITELDKLILLLSKNNKITLSLLTQILATILLSCTSNSDSEASDLTSILDLLPKLYYGLNIDPNFVTGTIFNEEPSLEFNYENILDIMGQNIPENSNPQNSSQQDVYDLGISRKVVARSQFSPEYSLFKALKIPVYHGWVLPDESSVETRLLASLKDFDSCQNFVIYIDELLLRNEDKNATKLTNEDKNLLKLASEIVSSWLDKSAAQFTDQGLRNLCVNNSGKANLAVFFRNDHFSTIYSHENRTFALVTDEGFSDLNIFWQELNSSSGDEKFYDSFFLEVTNDSLTSFPNPADKHISTEKADFSLAKQLQKEEMEAAENSKKEKKKKKKFLII